MKANKGLISALLGAALLAMPVAASAHDNGRNRVAAATYNQVRTFRPVVAQRAYVAPRAALANHVVPVRDRDDWRWRDRDNDRHNDRDDCRIAPPVNRYDSREGYRPNYLQRDTYNYTPQNYRAPVRAGLANLIRERDNARILYQKALRNGNHERAEHLRNDLAELNKRIAGVELHG